VPTLKEVYDGKQPVYLYQGPGFREELKGKYKQKVEELEEQGEKYGVKVLAVIKGTYEFPGGDKAEMIAYVYVDKQSKPWIINDTNVVGFMADVVNPTWNIEESGSVGIVEDPRTMIRRIM
jgi:hypothetical protein